MAKQASPAVGCLVLLIVAGVAVFLVSRCDSGDGPRPTRTTTRPAKATPEREKEIRDAMAALVQMGTVHSVNAEFNEVRINPDLWVPMDVETKRGVVMRFSGWFDELGSTARVTVRSSRDDSKLAEYSSLSGVTVHR